MRYRLLTGAAGALLDPLLALGGEGARARSGRGGPLPQGAIWVHAASLGEIASARWLIAALAARGPVVATSNTATGLAAARAIGVPAEPAPLDTPQAVGRLLARMRPRAAVTIEGELWPTRSAVLAEAGIPQIMVGARLSARSAARWARLPGLIGPMLARMAAVSAQDAGSEARLLALGLPADRLLPRVDLKLVGPARAALPPLTPDRAAVILAASTHAGEEEIVLDAVRGLPGARLILAPRHPQRFDAVAALMTAAGLPPARRSAGAGTEAPVLLADSMGEMDRWYAAAGICLTGGSWRPAGGHTPWEPAAAECALVHGPFIDNFLDSYRRLNAAGAAMGVEAANLRTALTELLADPARQRAMGRAARTLLMAEAGDGAALIAEIARIAGS